MRLVGLSKQLSLVLLGTATFTASVTLAQPIGAPTPGAGGPMGGPMGGDDNKPKGIVEEAPKQGAEVAPPVIASLPKHKRKQWKLFELDGYFRFRTDWLKRLHLGFVDDPDLGGAPFPQALGCSLGLTASTCTDNVQGADMRLRLNPSFNVTEGTAIYTTVDVLDNVILGSTPESLRFGQADNGGLVATSDSQAPTKWGQNDLRDNIVVKRLWAEIQVPLGKLKVGRMPNHWGLGILHNSGDQDPLTGVANTDSDYGDTVDRLSFSTNIPGTQLSAAFATDWASTRLVSSQTPLYSYARAWDLDDNDDVNQYSLAISQLDSPQKFQDKVERGELALNYGFYLGYRKQSYDYDVRDVALGETPSEENIIARGYKAYVLDAFGRLAWHNLLFETEATAILGSIGSLVDYGISDEVSLRQFGGVARLTMSALDNDFKGGVESAVASGDQWDPNVPGRIHVDGANLIGGAGDTKLTQFVFDRAYNVDMIFYRRLMGAVTNSLYVKPFVSYQLSKAFSFKVANVTAFALKPVATPGNETNWGTEFDTEVNYERGGLKMSLAYGMYIPLGAMNHPATVSTEGGQGRGFESGNLGDADNAHMVETRLVLSF